jgi:hypothetical protein
MGRSTRTTDYAAKLKRRAEKRRNDQRGQKNAASKKREDARAAQTWTDNYKRTEKQRPIEASLSRPGPYDDVAVREYLQTEKTTDWKRWTPAQRKDEVQQWVKRIRKERTRRDTLKTNSCL